MGGATAVTLSVDCRRTAKGRATPCVVRAEQRAGGVPALLDPVLPPVHVPDANAGSRHSANLMRTYVAFTLGQDGRRLLPLGTVLARDLSVARLLARLRWGRPADHGSGVGSRGRGSASDRGDLRGRSGRRSGYCAGEPPTAYGYPVGVRRVSACPLSWVIVALARDGDDMLRA